MHISFVGDIVPGGVLPYLNQTPVSPDIGNILRAADLRVGTLESAIGNDFAFDKVKMHGRMNIIYSRDEDIDILVKLGINVVSLANNHIFDLGFDGFENTLLRLQEKGILYCGAGSNIEEASTPAVVRIDNKSIAFLGCCDCHENQVAYVPVATENSYGVNPLYAETITAQIKKYKAIYDYVAVLVHWGIEYSCFPMKQSKYLAYAMAESGADIIIGSHTHRLQPFFKYRNTPIYFSLGNFLFPDFYINVPRPIWYPDPNDDLSAIEETFDYPYPVTKPMKRVWKSFSREGMIVDVSLNQKTIRTKEYKTILSRDNNLIKSHDDFSQLKVIAWLIRLPWYNGKSYILSFVRRIFTISKKIL